MKEQTINILQTSSNMIQGILWSPLDKPKAVLQIVHGMTEHIQRYKELAHRLTACGVTVAGYDLKGHGKNLPNSKCATFGENGWEESLKNIHVFSEFLSNRYPDIPHYIMGFSVGSFLIREYLNKFDHEFKGAIIAGTGYQPAKVLSVMKAIVKTQISYAGFDRTTALVKKLSFGVYNSNFKPNKTEFDWLCSDENKLREYILDPLCADSISAGLFYQLLESMEYTGGEDSYTNWNKKMPILLLSGDKDVVGNYGKGIEKVAMEMKKAGINDISMYLLPGARHDIFHEKANGCMEKAISLIDEWINL